MSLHSLSGHGVALILQTAGDPAVVHFGADPGDPPEQESTGPVLHSNYDHPLTLPLWPQASAGWAGTPFLEGGRGGRDTSASFADPRVTTGESQLTLSATDAETGLKLATDLELLPGGLLRLRHTLTNIGQDGYEVRALNAMLPVGQQATELLDTAGRWSRERSEQRLPFGIGTHARTGRRGRTGHDAPLLLAAGTPGFANRRGELWAAHLGWSGNSTVFAERSTDPSHLLGAGELPGTGEIVLETGQSHISPWVYFAYSDTGLDGVSARFHTYLRSRADHPRRTRPVVLNTWEAVYFQHDLSELISLAEAAAEAGVERFVLDDGWFGSRRDDTSGLGDWQVSPQVWPEGLTPLISQVNALGMEFGLWVEPEMANPDSELATGHPDWLCRARSDQLAPTWRNQYVVDLTIPAAYAHIFTALDTVLTGAERAGTPIAFLKWDQNRDQTDMASAGRPSQHRQTLAAYTLMDELKAAHPGLEIEACSSGGARVDLGVLEHADRVWASDSNDALERQHIQELTQRLLPPELVGQHIGPATAHTSGRTHALAFRGITALFGHFGLEWDIREAQGAERQTLHQLVGLYRKHRGLLHSGVSVRADLGDDAFSLYGTVAADGSEALYAFALLRSSVGVGPGVMALPGLRPEKTYRVSAIVPGNEPGTFIHREPPAWLTTGFTATGNYLSTVGLALPALNPERAILLHAEALEAL
ncbi:alpha-galactosidase [Arthrobacter rhombi]|uniref:alpha-galactosidase n=1 Tax=Arthrobacter rhombi TaxID=71253 RepID=UPI003FD3F3B3